MGRHQDGIDGLTERSGETWKWSDDTMENHAHISLGFATGKSGPPDFGYVEVLLAQSVNPKYAALVAAAPDMLALLLEFRDAFKPGEYIEDGQLDDLAIRVRTLLSGLDADKGSG